MTTTFNAFSFLKGSVGENWQTYDLSTTLISEILTFKECYVEVKNVDTENNITFKCFRFKDNITLLNEHALLTLNEFKETTEFTTLIFINAFPEENIRYSLYSHSWNHRFDVIRYDASKEVNTSQLVSEMPDLCITSPIYRSKMSRLHTHHLSIVNGYVHNSIIDGDSFFIEDGISTTQLSTDNDIGFISFEGIGNVNRIPFTDLDLISTGDGINQDMYHGVRYDISSLDINTIQIFVVIGGYLFSTLDSEYQNYNEFGIDLIVDDVNKQLSFNFKKFNIIKRLLESSLYLNMKNIDFNTYLELCEDVNDDRPFKTDEFISDYLSLSQSFVFIVNSKKMYYYPSHIRANGSDRNYTFNYKPTMPVFNKLNRIIDYIKTPYLKTFIMEPSKNFRDITIYDKALNTALVNQYPLEDSELKNILKNNEIHFKCFGYYDLINY